MKGGGKVWYGTNDLIHKYQNYYFSSTTYSCMYVISLSDLDLWDNKEVSTHRIIMGGVNNHYSFRTEYDLLGNSSRSNPKFMVLCTLWCAVHAAFGRLYWFRCMVVGPRGRSRLGVPIF